MPKYAYKAEFEEALLKALNLEGKSTARIIIDCKPNEPVRVYTLMYPELESPQQLTDVLAMLLKPDLTKPEEKN